MMAIKPIMFSTDMVRAILDGRKTQTRRIAKELRFTEKRSDGLDPSEFRFFISPKTGIVYWDDILRGVASDGKLVEAPYKYGDILWVKEKYCALPVTPGGHLRMHDVYYYRADGDLRPDGWRERWKGARNMPKKAARIFLRVKDVRVNRLGNTSEEDAIAEGFADSPAGTASPLERFAVWWNEHFKWKERREFGWYGSWYGNPIVWVIEFERCEKPEGWLDP